MLPGVVAPLVSLFGECGIIGIKSFFDYGDRDAVRLFWPITWDIVFQK